MSVDAESSRSSAAPVGDERHVKVDEGQNAIAAQASGSSWISLCRHGVEIVREANGEPLVVFTVEPGDYTVRTDGALGAISIERREIPLSALQRLQSGPRATLHISSDAPDVHVVDGVGEIPADGTSAATVTVQKVDAAGARLTEDDGGEIFLRATGGVLMAANADHRIRSVRLRAGVATLRLVSETSPRLVTLFAFSADRLLTAELPIEFV